MVAKILRMLRAKKKLSEMEELMDQLDVSTPRTSPRVASRWIQTLPMKKNIVLLIMVLQSSEGLALLAVAAIVLLMWCWCKPRPVMAESFRSRRRVNSTGKLLKTMKVGAGKLKRKKSAPPARTPSKPPQPSLPSATRVAKNPKVVPLNGVSYYQRKEGGGGYDGA